ncbi:DUF1629 domain-containing protein [Stenotrophomonas oahuensis]|uniref:DUF1629 domain-containing protein n=1 Tax=Stenotrophomonas oahuensis TaxID=3003271 RepID=A0ABY9YPD1_9GAMM|nr:DUF1629 domain-containing protein [Stenotrophomonas sp. A5586]WNH52744.1 DUF1629 domain-containing protein [Stenotrophomonas sp. A5586]
MSGAFSESKAKPGQFFRLRPDARCRGPGHGVLFENEQDLVAPPRLSLRPKGGGFPSLPSVPRLVHVPANGPLPEDLEGGFSGYWLVSERLKHVMQSVDPDAFAFTETDYRLADGSIGPAMFLCDVVRTVDALDEMASEVLIEVSDDFEAGKYYDLAGGAKLAFRKDALGSAHVFKLPFNGAVFCDRTFKDAVEAAGISGPDSSGGLWFSDAVSS